MKFRIVVVCTLRKVYDQVTKWPSDQWPSDQWPTDQLYPVVIVMKFCIVVVCTPLKVYHQVTKWPSDRDQVTKWQVKKMMNNIEATILNGKFSKWPSDQVTKWPVTNWPAVPCGDCNEILHSCSVHAQKGLSPSD
jgi:hypothetical protein